MEMGLKVKPKGKGGSTLPERAGMHKLMLAIEVHFSMELSDAFQGSPLRCVNPLSCCRFCHLCRSCCLC